MAWIEKHDRGFRASWRDASGKVKRGPSRSTKDEAESWAIAAGHMEAPKHNLDDLVDDFCETRVADGGIKKTYAADLRQRLPSLFKSRKWTNVEDVTPTAIDAWWKDTKGVGVDRPLAQLLSLLRFAFQRRDIAVHPRLLVYKKPRRSRTVKDHELLSDDQIEQILEAASSVEQREGMREVVKGFAAHAIALLHYLSTYGPRPTTACQHRIRAVNFERGTLKLSAKRSGEWEHPLDDVSLKYFALIAKDRKPDDFLFLDYLGRPWKLTAAGEAERLCWWYKKHIGAYLNLSPRLRTIYRIKDYVVSRMRKLGIDDETICSFTGHLTKSQLDNYDHTSEQLKRLALQKMLQKSVPPKLPPNATQKPAND